MGNGERSFNCGKSSSFPCKEAIIETWKRKRGKKRREKLYMEVEVGGGGGGGGGGGS